MVVSPPPWWLVTVTGSGGAATADELEPHRTADGFLDLTIRAWINGELLDEDSLANMAFTFEELVSSPPGARLAPPATCSPPAPASAAALPRSGAGRRGVPPPLVPGDVVTLQVEGLGTVRSQLVDPAPCPPIPRARKGRPRGPRH